MRRTHRWFKRIALLPLAAAALAAPALPSCGGDRLLRAKRIEQRAELVGGPVAMADVGDFLLENDQIRVAILGGRDSPGPGIFGGAIVDVDRRRGRIGEEGGQGRDRFAEMFSLANLIVPDPTATDVSVLADGTDGAEAGIRVEGDGEFLFEAIGLLRAQEDLLGLFFPNVRSRIRFRTDYLLHPGDRFVTVRTVLLLDDRPLPGCEPQRSCEACPNGYKQDSGGCLTCECSDVLPLDNATAPVSVFGGVLGDPLDEAQEEASRRAGIVAGDFVFFGNQNDVFAPGAGFDEDTAVQDAWNAGRNSFQEPLTFDFVAAAGGDVSYGYFTKAQEGAAPPVVNVPLFASAATAFVSASRSCLFSEDDDAACDAHRAFSYERYLAVGDGDIASVTDVMHRLRGTATGTVSGHVLWEDTLDAVPNARVFVFSDPDPSRPFGSLDELAAANREARGDVGLVNEIDADLGLDPSEDGDFRGALPPGSYLLVARNAAGTATSAPVRVSLRAGEQVAVSPRLPAPATVRYRAADESGQRIPAKLAFVSLDGAGRRLPGDGRRRVYLGDGRLGNGNRAIEVTATGEGEVEIEPGRYQITVSRGIEYGIYVERDVTLAPGRAFQLDATLVREVDTSGWMSADMHLHSKPSFDSGMPLPRRVATVAAEGVELAVSTDHDVETDYRPTVRALGLEPHLATAVGAEITTLEQGHFIGFPLKYDELDVPSHGAHDWTCEPGGTILDAIRASGDGTVEPLTIVAHPRDGFFGYVEQLGVDTYTMARTPTFLEENNPVFRTASCEFDAMEIINGKRFDLVRTPSLAEVVDWNRCLARLNAAQGAAEIEAACPEVAGWLRAPCAPPGAPMQGAGGASGPSSGAAAVAVADCKRRARTELAWALMKRVLARTPDEQEKNWSFPGATPESQELCGPAALGDGPVAAEARDEPCTYRAGQVDDYFRYLERGFVPAQIASSDSHDSSKEPGFPRTYFRSATDSPAALETPAAVESLRGAHAFTTYGPFVRATIGGKTYGEVAAASAGKASELLFEVQTASWFGVDRVEIYLNGTMIRLLEPDMPPSALVDVRGKVTFTVPERDSWVVLIAMGLEDRNLMSPVSLDVPFGEIQLSRLASDAFGRIPAINALFAPTPTVPDWSPVPPYAVTNPIYIDVDGNGRYDAPLPSPEFCSRPCDPAVLDPAQCPAQQDCLLEEAVCGFPIPGKCDHRRPALGHHDD
ncbi:PHP domain-containing protein [Sorangium sp. So ce1078]|uniref:PHP domain-containing protein n=1 Tax=Sorangium sp. So ce1078 TaxID=3133329 RepID=UPI003F63A285